MDRQHLTRHLQNATEPNVTIEGAQVRRVGVAGSGQLAKLLCLFSFWWWLIRRYKSVSIVNAILEADYAIVAILAGMGSRTTMTWATRGDATYWLSGPMGRLRSEMLRRCQQVALTNVMQVELEALGQDIKKIIAVPVDIARFSPPSKVVKAHTKSALGLKEELVVVFSGHLERRKGVDVLLRAFSNVLGQEIDVGLIILGGENRSKLQYVSSLHQITQEKNISDRVRFLGAVDDVLPFLLGADLFCLPSWREGMPNSIIEAMACGLTCIAPASAGGDELLCGGAGIVPSSNSPEDLAAAMDRALRDETLRDSIYAKKQFSGCVATTR